MAQPGVTQLQDIKPISNTVLQRFIQAALNWKIFNAVNFLDFDLLIFSSSADCIFCDFC